MPCIGGNCGPSAASCRTVCNNGKCRKVCSNKSNNVAPSTGQNNNNGTAQVGGGDIAGVLVQTVVALLSQVLGGGAQGQQAQAQ